SRASSVGEQPPQSVPAPQIAARRSRVSPPRAIVARIAWSGRPRQRQTIMSAILLSGVVPATTRTARGRRAVSRRPQLAARGQGSLGNFEHEDTRSLKSMLTSFLELGDPNPGMGPRR